VDGSRLARSVVSPGPGLAGTVAGALEPGPFVWVMGAAEADIGTGVQPRARIKPAGRRILFITLLPAPRLTAARN
jgi:hypothetical protein